MTDSSLPTIQKAAPLKGLNTFQVSAIARSLAHIESEGSLIALLQNEAFRDEPRLVLGGGSNVLFTGDFPGLVLHMRIRGIEVKALAGEAADSLGVDEISVGAGENWDAFVRWSLDQGYEGLENLILIPGSVGASPMQNIGAYGVEVAQFVHRVRALDCRRGEVVELDREGCAFAYRDSLFKRQRGRFIITRVIFRLPRRAPRVLHYAGVADRLSQAGVSEPSAWDVARVVEAIRQEKLPDPACQGNAGSFFKNPIVPADRAEALKAQYPELPMFPADQEVKLSAAWLLEACGFKGLCREQAGFSRQHALVLVNLGAARGEALWSLALEAQAGVKERFGVELEPEPLVI